ncbi:NAD(P)/FAD-dependent oxidoreductase [Anaerovibrio lipolyticus]|uniref:NAD(P)/FAD-dependent oxidoreductase n=1 Tax=Anaerovibrio lipolyticus TaxID=82374 RepID=UPI0026EAE7F6|nr:NAD(P)/FAD-dependent oxidoreductase [Anaerovibrio lipolyticus]MBE6105389.1 NAD(P)/FAD-dependent oxidoreductase [Anaerovibrio lipolyticus]
MDKIVVVGAGPAGMMAAIKAAENGASVVLLEKMKRAGKKMLITGKGRCNITNVAEIPELIKNIPGNGKFLNSCIRAFDNEDVQYFFNGIEVPTKVERGGRVFPVSDKAADVVDAMVLQLHELGVKLYTDVKVSDILVQDNKAVGVKTDDGQKFEAEAVIIATGGSSYPGTGSTGDGYKMADKIGHKVVTPLPALVPLELEEEWVKDLQGLSLKNVRVTLFADEKRITDMFGEMLFTHFGVSGPIILSLSRKTAQLLDEGSFVELMIDLKPALTFEQLDARVLRDFEKYQRKEMKNALKDLLPGRLIPPVLDGAYIEPDRMVNSITKEERHRLVNVLKGLLVTVTKTRPIAEAIVTAGGVDVKEINPKTMESKLIKNLYFAGEVVDVDAYTGGYNLQAAFSMGAAAGNWSVWNDEEE